MTEITDLETKIIKQVEYYFSDVNLGRDKFLQEQRKLDEGWVAMETMLKFNRLKQLSDSQEAIVAALKKATSGLVEVSEDNKKIRRSLDKPLPEFTKEAAEELAARSIYVKGFPKELKLDEAMEFFEKFAPVDQVHMRKAPNKQFKGSCFVTFKDKEGASKFMNAEAVKFKDDHDLTKLYKDEYFKSKNKALTTEKEKKKQEKKEKTDEAVKSRMVTGAILKVEGLAAETPMDKIKKKFEEFGKVQWVDVDEEKKEAKIRFSEENQAKTALEKVTEASEGGVIKFDEQELKCSVLEGDEEFRHWKEVVSAMGQSNKRKMATRGSHRAKKARR